MQRFFMFTGGAFALCLAAIGSAGEGNRLTYLSENNPYYVSRTFPKLTTPQWVGEDGVEAVVVLAIDDMRETEKYEKYLRPILQRLKQIDGRAPVSIMTCRIDPKSAQLQSWLAEGLSFEIHTYDHPCPLLSGGSFAKARETYDRCVDLLFEVPGNKPVAFRMPCCDSLNTVSPRFYAEIFNKVTEKGHFLSLDSSVFNLCTSNDPDVPRELVIDADGRDKFRKYVPQDRAFVNTIEDYPYPFVIGGLCWEFPCIVPSDWSAQHLQKPNNPDTVRDLKAALDVVVLKQGVYNLVFHPHGWIRNDQVIELIDHAVNRYGRKVKFLTFKEAQERLNTNLLHGQPLRDERGRDNGIRLLDIDRDGYLDVLIGNSRAQETRIWSRPNRSWKSSEFPALLAAGSDTGHGVARFGIVHPDGLPSVVAATAAGEPVALHYSGEKWVRDEPLSKALQTIPSAFFARSRARLQDLDGDGVCELIAPGDGGAVFSLSGEKNLLKHPFTLPAQVPVAETPADAATDDGLRFVDLDEDGFEDVLFSNEERYSVHLFESMTRGWAREVLAGKRGAKDAQEELPMISRKGTNNGAWFHSRHLWVQNEDTAKMKDLVDRRSFAAMLGQDEPRARSPVAAAASLVPRPGFAVELVAAEPLTQDPVAFAWGPDGKFWIVEMADYPLGIDGKGRHGGRVRFLEDLDGDGKYDKSTLFLEGIGFPTGVMPWRKGVLVTAAPDIFYAADTDGDGRADQREILYTGFSEGNQQHRVNGLAWGLDNWLYCANGDSGGTIKSIKTGKSLDIRGRDLRIRPDDGALDAQAGQTQFGRNRDDWGNWFGCNNSNPMYQFVIPDQYLRRNPHYPAPDTRVNVSVAPGASPVFPLSRTLARFNDLHTANRFTSACSVIVYRDDLFGPHFAGNSFVSEPVHNLVHREVLTTKGFTFSSQRASDEQQSEFLASTDNWFRPTMIRTGPDGALWVADMYRHVIEHPQWIPADWQKRLDLRAGHDKGRIYRVAPVGKPRRTIPRLDRLDTPQLVAAVDSPSGWQRDMAQQMLVERQDRSAVPLLAKLASDSPRALCRLHALCALEGLQALTLPVLLRGLQDEHPGVRRHAIRLCETLAAPQSPEIVDTLLRQVSDSDPHVRLQLACTLGEIRDPRVGTALGHLLLEEGSDRWMFSAVMSSINKSNIDSLLAAIIAGKKAAGAQADPPNFNLVENLLGMAAAFGNDKALTSLLSRVASPARGKYSAAQFQAVGGLLDTLDRQNTPLSKLNTDANAALRTALAQLDGILAAARTTALDEAAADSDRVAAVRLLGRGPAGPAAELTALASLLGPQSSVELQQAAISTLGRLRDARVPAVVLEHWKGYGPLLRPVVLDLFLSRDEWQDLLLTALETQEIAPLDVDASRRQRMLDHKSQRIRERAARIFSQTGNTDRRKVLVEYRPAVTLTGDAARGAPLFAKACAQCHKLAGSGFEVGPDLAALSDKSPESLLAAILDPNRAVENKFVNYTAVTKSGLSFNGLLASETGNSITLKGPEARQQTILRADLEELIGSSKSTMPEGLEKDLKPQDVADIMAYVRSNVPLPKRKEFAANKPAVVQAGADGALQLLPVTCEIFGPSIVLEEKYGNLGYWSSPDDYVVWTIDVARADKYAVELNWACDNTSAGNVWKLDAETGSLTATVSTTGNWDTYRQAAVGEISLEAGRQRITMRSAGKIKGSLLDLKSIRLVPMK